MRLTLHERAAISNRCRELAPGGDAFLFGSRTDPQARGGDIDILLLTDAKLPMAEIRRLRRAILGDIGEQRLDIVNFPRTSDAPFKAVAMHTAVKL